MSCRSKPIGKNLKPKNIENMKSEKHKFIKCKPDDLNDVGREQFFEHYSKSKLPIRNITRKPEPHIEIDAENYLSECYQPSIRSFCQSKEKYLFLCTTCKNKDIGDGNFFGRRFVVGYIVKMGWKNMGNHIAVFGNTYIVPFDPQLEYSRLELKRTRGMNKINEWDTNTYLSLILHII